MATSNERLVSPIPVLEDLDTHLYVAFAVVDGKVANSAHEATGILLSKPQDGEAGQIGYVGEMKFKAGGALTKGDKITVATSGYFTSGGSADVNVGECLRTVTSGSVGTGLFAFQANPNLPAGFTASVTAADAITAGKPYALSDNSLAQSPGEADAIAPTTIASGSTGIVYLSGTSPATLADSYGIGQRVMVAASGYFTAVTSGYVSNGLVTTAATSGEQGAVFFCGSPYLAVSA